MSDYKKNVNALTYEELLQKNLELRQTITNLRNQIDENNKWTATVYEPNKCTYQQLELKLKNFEAEKQKEIDELKIVNHATEQRIAQYIEDKKSLNIEIQKLKLSNLNLTDDVFDLRRENKLLHTVINYAAGYISSCEQFRDKHPNYVKSWLFEELK